MYFFPTYYINCFLVFLLDGEVADLVKNTNDPGISGRERGGHPNDGQRRPHEEDEAGEEEEAEDPKGGKKGRGFRAENNNNNNIIPLRVDSQGNLLDGNGKQVQRPHDRGGGPYRMDPRGNILDSQGEVIQPYDQDCPVYDHEGRPLNLRDKGPIKTDSRGNLLDKKGRILPADNGPFRTDSKGNVFDGDGVLIASASAAAAAAASPSSSLSGRGGLALEKDGKPLIVSADRGPFKTDSKGNLLDNMDRPINVDNGPFRTDSRGNIWDGRDKNNPVLGQKSPSKTNVFGQDSYGPNNNNNNNNKNDNNIEGAAKDGRRPNQHLKSDSQSNLVDQYGQPVVEVVPLAGEGFPYRTDSRGSLYDRDGSCIANNEATTSTTPNREGADQNSPHIKSSDMKDPLSNSSRRPSSEYLVNSHLPTSRSSSRKDFDGPQGNNNEDGQIRNDDNNNNNNNNTRPLRVDSKGNLLGPDGKKIDQEQGPFRTDPQGNIFDGDDNIIQSADSRGPLRTNSKGNLLGVNNTPVTQRNGPFRTDSQGNIMDNDGNLIQSSRNGVLRTDSKGNLLGPDGKLVSKNSGPFRKDSQNNILDKNDRMIQPSGMGGPLRTDSVGNLLGTDGRAVTKQNGPFRTDSRGNILDCEDKLIQPANSRGPLNTDSKGNLLGTNGKPVTQDQAPFRRDLAGNIMDKDGHLIQPSGLGGPLKPDSEGNLVGSDGKPVTEQRGPFKTDSNGNILDRDGKLIMPATIGGILRTDTSGSLWGADGKPIHNKNGPYRTDSKGNILSNGGKVIQPGGMGGALRTDSMGNLYGADGKPINSKKGPFRSDSKGNILDKEGNIIQSTGEKEPIIPKPILDSNDRSQEPLRTDSKGNIYGPDGALLNTNHGPFRTDSEGNILDGKGKIIQPAGSKGPLRADSCGNIFANGGTPINTNNKPFRTDSMGNIFDNSGKIVQSNRIGAPLRSNSRGNVLGTPMNSNQGPFRTDSSGNIFDGDGKIIQPAGTGGPLRTDSSGNLFTVDELPINSGLCQMDSKGNLLDKTDNRLEPDGIVDRLKTDSEGNICANNGTIINTDKAPFRTDSRGNIVDRDGVILQQGGGIESPLKADSRRNICGPDGESIPYSKGPFRADSRGNIMDSNNKVIQPIGVEGPLRADSKGNLFAVNGIPIDTNKGPFRTDSKGNILDRDDTIIQPAADFVGSSVGNAPGLKGSNNSGRGTFSNDSRENILDGNEKIAQPLGAISLLSTDSRGNLCTADGTRLNTNNGPFRADSKGNILDKTGKLIQPAHMGGSLRTDSKGNLLSGTGKPINTNNGPFRTDSKGNVLDSNDQIVESIGIGGPLRADSRGNIYSPDGTRIIANNGPFRTDSAGNILDGNGTIIQPAGAGGPLSADSRGNLWSPDGSPINPSRFRMDSKGNLLDNTSKPSHPAGFGSQGSRGNFFSDSLPRAESIGTILKKQHDDDDDVILGPLRVDSKGNLFCADGKVIDSPRGPFKADSSGNILDRHGQVIQPAGGAGSNALESEKSRHRYPSTIGDKDSRSSRNSLLPGDEDARNAFQIDLDGNLFDNNTGIPIHAENGPFRKSSNGNSLVDKDGHHVNPDKCILDSDGNLVDTSSLGPLRMDSSGSLLDVNGRRVSALGNHPVHVDPQSGIVYDNDGNMVGRENPRKSSLLDRHDGRNSLGVRDGKKEGEDDDDLRNLGRPDSMGYTSASNRRPSRTDSRQSGGAAATAGFPVTADLLDKSGRPMNHVLGPLRTDSVGNLYDQTGRLLDEAEGYPFYTDPRGNVFDKEDNLVGKSARKESKGSSSPPHHLGLNRDEVPGRAAKADPSSSLESRSQSRASLLVVGRMDSRESIPPHRKSSDMAKIYHDKNNQPPPGGGDSSSISSGPWGKTELVDESGKPVNKLPSGPFRTDSAGNIFDRAGRPVLTQDGPIRADSRGNLWNPDGTSVNPKNLLDAGTLLQHTTKVPSSSSSSAAASSAPTSNTAADLEFVDLVDRNGRPIDLTGREPLRVDSSGNLLDKNGKLVPLANGPFHEDIIGNIYDKEDRPLVLSGGKPGDRKTDLGSPLDNKDRVAPELGSKDCYQYGGGYIPESVSSNSLLDGNNRPLDIMRGMRIDSRGNLLDRNGKPVNAEGGPFHEDTHGNIYDKDGRSIAATLQTGRRKSSSSPASPLLLDRDGTPIDIRGKTPLRTDSRGALLDRYGNPVSAANGPFRTDSRGNIYDKNDDAILDKDGNPIENMWKTGPHRGETKDILGDDGDDDDDRRGRQPHQRPQQRRPSSPGSGFRSGSEMQPPFRKTDSRGNVFPGASSPSSVLSRTGSRNHVYYSGEDGDGDDVKRNALLRSPPSGGSGPPPYPPVELTNIPLPTTGGEVEARIETPSGGTAFPFIEDNGNGTIGLSYQPNEAGAHIIDVKYNDEHVQGSPYKFHSSPLEDGKVHAHGSGLIHGVCGDPGNFVISTRGAGAGGLALAVEGPSKAEINCLDNKDGTVNVSYLPTAPGEYKISAKFADKHIEGSPFTCKVTGEGKKRNAISVGGSSDVTLPENLSEYDLRALNAYIVSPSGNEEPCFLKKLPKGNTGISFTPKEVGEHLVSVKRDEKHIKNSPFKIKVKPEDVGDASKVKVGSSSSSSSSSGGPGIDPALTTGRTHKDNMFHVDTRNAGYGGLSLSVEGPSKAEINCNDHGDGSLDVSYRPTEPGLYIVNLKFADQHVPGSPYAVAVSGEGSEKLKQNVNHMREAVPVTEVGSQCRLTFKMPGIGSSDLEASVVAPSGKVIILNNNPSHNQLSVVCAARDAGQTVGSWAAKRALSRRGFPSPTSLLEFLFWCDNMVLRIFYVFAFRGSNLAAL